ncbi:MAG: glycosyltransferase [Eubacteriales bacterium]|nr:glycosyltransferase [Eubacteriales bacterium]
MRVLLINVVCGIRSTGRICTDLAEALETQGHDVKIAYGREAVPEKFRKYALRTESDLGIKLSAMRARVSDNAGFSNRLATIRLVEKIREFDPDVIHLHVLHGYWINIEVLFEYLRECGKKIIWTFHDCWAFTGHCAYFDYVACDKWISGCSSCPDKNAYPASILADRSEVNYLKKKSFFTGIPDMHIVTPSKWLADYVRRSFLKEYPVEVIPNGIDTDVFCRNADTIQAAAELKERYGLEGKKLVIAVSTSWDRRKGLQEYFKLADELGEGYQVAVIGLSEEQAASVPSNVLGIQRTDSVRELAGFYVLAHAYVNASLEENYPTTNLEAIACGTPVIAYNTGGSGESAEIFGTVVPKGNISALSEAVQNAKQTDSALTPEEIKRLFSFKRMTEKYLEIY